MNSFNIQSKIAKIYPKKDQDVINRKMDELKRQLNQFDYDFTEKLISANAKSD